MGDADARYILLFTACDRVGIVSAVSSFLADHDGFILDSQQYADLESGNFFMRVEFKGVGERFPASRDALSVAFAPVAERFAMEWLLVDAAERLKIMIAVSKGSHCLNDLLHRWSTGGLAVEIAGVVSNHENCRALTEWHGVPFHYLPVSGETRAAQEQDILALMKQTGAEQLVLARYMQVLSGEMVDALDGRCINIHHSFLPSFKGAGPYHRAHARGVKLIGATAHFVTGDLDEGPIIEQAVERIDHRASAEDMIRIGRDIEAQVLSRAVRWVAERRVLRNGLRTVVFS
ncbi:formyltetrahydrofolate deformylase [Sphingobium subterraneum]|uniref:Formyltetrahydrofolate deformylase n=1 Tax=Sphingobium subterraneum TaxID=627688 RepID=A0A841IXU2_9SPHN|nr:formyltetrahydrofolate deformylase [Sphingobium subterraneum]MBB6123483.1 formyltetrahydrofolate deformylase [Sphingobium subterraneum]